MTQDRFQVTGPLRLSDSAADTHDGFAAWRKQLVSGATARGGDMYIGDMGVRDLHPAEAKVDLVFWLGDSEDAAVQINEPNDPATENGLAAMARDEDGRRYIVRQAWLKKNNASPAVRDAAFARLTGLPPAELWRGNRKARRQWHVVARIDDAPGERIRSDTADFVERCWRARLTAAGIEGLLERIESEETAAALLFLMDEARSAGFDFVFRASKAVRGVEFQDATGSNLYSFTANRAHLLVFLRMPAQKRATNLMDAAQKHYGPQEPNSRGEYRVTVRTRAEAERLLVWLQSVGAWHDIISPVGRNAPPRPAAFDAVNAVHLLAAARKLADGFSNHPFGTATDHAVIFEGQRLAPAALFGLAASAALGRSVGPGEFETGHGTPCFRILSAAGYPIVATAEAVAAEPDLSDDDRQWAEGHTKLVTHLKRERGHGLSAAKRARFRATHGSLFCERCGLDPVARFGSSDGEACIEVHHAKIAVSEMRPGHRTELDDLECLCANCHRVAHRQLKRDVTAPVPDGARASEAIAPVPLPAGLRRGLTR